MKAIGVPKPSFHEQVPLISICIPTLNRARFLREALASIGPQLGLDAELIVYDTGSTDGTPRVMEEALALFPAIQYIRREEVLGVDETLLQLLAASRGEYVWFFGSDDVLERDALDKIRKRIGRAPERPTLIYVNHGITDIDGRLLIRSQFLGARDCRYSEGWRCVGRLGIKLGYISSCIVCRKKLPAADDAAQLIGSRWVSLHLYLSALRNGGSLEFIAEPLVRARRNPSACSDYAEVFVKQLARVFKLSRKNGYPRLAIHRAMNSVIAGQYLRFVFSWRADNPCELSRTFPVMLESCWRYPAFWLLIVPVRFAPAAVVRRIRDWLRGRREHRNEARTPISAAAVETGK